MVIFENRETQKTGAQSIAPDHSPRQRATRWAASAHALRPAWSRTQRASLQQRVEQFLFYQSELLDQKQWQAYIDLFDRDGVYWMPVTPEQTEWLDSPSIFAEDRRMMEIRMGRVQHPNAWSQAPQWGTSHMVGNVVIESAERERDRGPLALPDDGAAPRPDCGISPAPTGTRSSRDGDDFKIALQRVDLLNGQAPFDYVLQIWV